jgi:hypothetical protein
MLTYGFLPSHPIQCTWSCESPGKLEVISGGHRAHYAKKHGLIVYYVIDDTCTTPAEMETPGQDWGLRQYIDIFASDKLCPNQNHYKLLRAYIEEHRLPVQASVSLVAGGSASSHHLNVQVRAGQFTSGNQRHATEVARIIDGCYGFGVTFARQAAFVQAVSKCLWVPEFNMTHFLDRVKKHRGDLEPSSMVPKVLQQFEAVYNRNTQVGNGQIALAFRATEEGKKRQLWFGRKQKEEKSRKEAEQV